MDGRKEDQSSSTADRPLTVRRLKRILDQEGINPKSYSLRGGLPDERYCLEQAGDGLWSVYGSERGHRVSERFFQTEAEACEQLLYLVRRDPSTRR